MLSGKPVVHAFYVMDDFPSENTVECFRSFRLSQPLLDVECPEPGKVLVNCYVFMSASAEECENPSSFGIVVYDLDENAVGSSNPRVVVFTERADEGYGYLQSPFRFWIHPMKDGVHFVRLFYGGECLSECRLKISRAVER